MTARDLAWALILAALGGALAFRSASAEPSREKPVRADRIAVLNLRDCLDRAQNAWCADNEAEVQKLMDSQSGRAGDLNPLDRQRTQTKILDLSNQRKLEVYTEIVRVSGIVARERGCDLVQKVDRVPVFEPGEPEVGARLERREIVSFDPEIDITREVLARINRDRAARKK